VETHFFPNPGDNNAALVGGSLQLTINPFTLPYLGRASGADIQIVASMGGSGVMEVVAQREINIANLDQLADARNRNKKVKIGTLQGDTLDVIVYRALRDRNTDYDQFDMVWFNDLLAMVQAFRSKQLDVLSHIKPYTTDLIQSMGAVSLGTNASVWGDGTPNCVVLGMQAFLDKHPEAVRAFLSAITRGYKFGQSSPDEAARILTAGKYYQVGEAVLRQALAEQSPQFFIAPNETGMKTAIDDLVSLNYMQPVKFDIFRREFMTAA